MSGKGVETQRLRPPRPRGRVGVSSFTGNVRPKATEDPGAPVLREEPAAPAPPRSTLLPCAVLFRDVPAVPVAEGAHLDASTPSRGRPDDSVEESASSPSNSPLPRLLCRRVCD